MCKNDIHQSWFVAVLVFCLLLSGCVAGAYDHSSKRASDLQRYNPLVDGQLKLRRVTHDAIAGIQSANPPKNVFVIVHPAYTFFFRDEAKGKLSNAKYELANDQFTLEKTAIMAQAAAGSVVVLVLPGNFGADSSDPVSYVSYLNSMSDEGQHVYYVLSEASSTGTLPVDDMVSLYSFLQALKVSTVKVMIGGGYVGRCQREFYNQLTAYLDRSLAYIVPEISTISPDDVSDSEAMAIFTSLQQQNFGPVKAFIDKKVGSNANVQSMPE